MDSAVKQVALTFDDGPNGDYTLAILDILKSYDIKAAFFFPGKNLERSPQIALKVKSMGHIIGNHTYAHPHLNTMRPEQVLSEIEKAESVFRDILGFKPRYFRPPYGECNDGVRRLIIKRGYRIVLWDMECYSMDWKNPPPDTIADISTRKARDGSIILLHDGRNIRENEPRDNTVKALEIIIPDLQKKGFSITTLDMICKD
jgi:peptidoglycan-N-acetylglucosamine deacetylase